jgi:GT2 family glycosyltransferase
MSFRRTVFEWAAFDERLSGYAIGEDIDFTYRVRQCGRLVVLPPAQLVHHHAPTNRLSNREIMRTDVVHRALRVAGGTGRYSIGAFWLSVVVEATAAVARLMRGQRSAFHHLCGLLDGAKFVLGEVRSLT